MLRSWWQGWRRDPAAAPVVAVVSTRDPFRRALTISLLNPKSLLFFLSSFIKFVDRSSPFQALSFVVLGLIAQIAGFTSLISLILFDHPLASAFPAWRLRRPRGTGVVCQL